MTATTICWRFSPRYSLQLRSLGSRAVVCSRVSVAHDLRLHLGGFALRRRRRKRSEGFSCHAPHNFPIISHHCLTRALTCTKSSDRRGATATRRASHLASLKPLRAVHALLGASLILVSLDLRALVKKVAWTHFLPSRCRVALVSAFDVMRAGKSIGVMLSDHFCSRRIQRSQHTRPLILP